jgi:hypothetical protein
LTDPGQDGADATADPEAAETNTPSEVNTATTNQRLFTESISVTSGYDLTHDRHFVGEVVRYLASFRPALAARPPGRMGQRATEGGREQG